MNGLDFPRLLCPGDNFRTVLWVPSQVGFSADSAKPYKLRKLKPPSTFSTWPVE